MPRSYRHIQQYEKEILDLKEKGLTRKEIGERFGFTAEQIHDFTKRYNRKQAKLAAGIAIHRKGRPLKGGYKITAETSSTELRYILARKELRIKQLEMENELMRDFLLLTERK